MSLISLNKFGQNLPVTGIMSLSQAAVGFGVGLLIAEKLGRSARHRTAVALIGAGTATILPFVLGVISHVNNRPGSSRDMERRLSGIRREAGLANDHHTY